MKAKILEIVIDGYGYNPELEIEILKSVFSGLTSELKNEFINKIYRKLTVKNVPEETAFILFFNRNHLNVFFEKKYKILSNLTNDDIKNVKGIFSSLKDENKEVITQVKEMIKTCAKEKKYAVWAAETPNIERFREKYPSVPTKTCGLEAGYEKLNPEVQGNSETGHQQLGNMMVATQLPLEIASDIETGKFFENPVLNESVKTAIDNNCNLNVTILVSGEFGDDGRVHSCWNHLDNYLNLALVKHKFDPGKLRIQAILDGRDCPLKSSLEKNGEKYGFLYKLKDMAAKYNADDCVAWIIGRGIAMDRDYEEGRTKRDYELLVKGNGRIAADFDDAIEIVKKLHEEEVFDPFVEPIIVKDKTGSIRKIERNDVVINLNFRADRQRARVASLLGAKEFLQNEVGQKGKKWDLDWIRDGLNLSVFCITEYHPDLEKYGAKIAYPVNSHPHNFLSIFCQYFKENNIPFKYLLMAESNKALHMGYFIRGRREKIETEGSENRYIIPSYAKEDGIFTDDDFYKTPHMKAFEIAGKLLNELTSGTYDLAIINFSNPDMLGHLICKHFDANVKALETVDYVIKTVIEFVLQLGYHVIITSDHGNIDENSASHSLNDIITTFISPKSDICLTKNADEKIRLFDIPWAIAEIFNISKNIKDILPPVSDWIIEKGLMGEVPIMVKR